MHALFYGHPATGAQTSVLDRYDPREARETCENRGGSLPNPTMAVYYGGYPVRRSASSDPIERHTDMYSPGPSSANTTACRIVLSK